MSCLISLNNVSMAWNRRTILDNISLDICRGDFLAVSGPNGGGKTTLMKIILRLLLPTRGTVTYCDPRLSVGYLPQKNMIDARFPLTVGEVIGSGLLGRRDLSADARHRLIGETLATVDLTEHASKPIGLVSGGQLQRALIGRAIIPHPSLLVMDEPLSYLDKPFEKKLYELLDGLRESTTIILVSHEMSTISSMATRHIIIDTTLRDCHARSHAFHCDCDL